LGFDLGHQCVGLGDVVRVAPGETERQWIAQRIDDYVDFCRKAAARAPMAWSQPPYMGRLKSSAGTSFFRAIRIGDWW
jgi:hypothetical protein